MDSIGNCHSLALHRLNQVDLNKSADTAYVIEPGALIKTSKPQVISKTGVWIIGGGGGSSIDADVKWKHAHYTFTDKAVSCGVANVTLMGHDGGEVVTLRNARAFHFLDINQAQHPAHHGGVTPITTDGSDGLVIKNLSTQRVARYSIYLGDASKHGNKNFVFENLMLGPCEIVENKQSSGMVDGNLQGGGPSEHCIRIYGASHCSIRIGKANNAGNKDGKQAIKVMSGDDVLIEDFKFDGSSRFGRDDNDPATYRLTNVVIRRCEFNEWVRIDPGASVVMENSVVSARTSGNVFDMHQDGKLKIKNVVSAYAGNGRFSFHPEKIDTKAGGNTFNGKPV
jgi:hypothetical protein